MIRRCYKQDDPAYHNYGGRGIAVCDEWVKSVESFYVWAMNNGYKDNLSIDRIDNNGDYCPDNCRWADEQTQSNNRRSNIHVTINGNTQNITQWCKQFGISSGRIFARIEHGWNPVEALTYKEDARISKRKTRY